MSHLIADSRISQVPFDPFAPTDEQAAAMDRLALAIPYDPWPDELLDNPQFQADMNAREQELAERMGLSAHAGSIHGHDVLFVTCPSETREQCDTLRNDNLDAWHAAHDDWSKGWDELERDCEASRRAEEMVERIADAEIDAWRAECDAAAEMEVVS
jgi:hypothetical protein